MFARFTKSIIPVAAKKVVQAPKFVRVQQFGSHAGHGTAAAASGSDVVIPELVDTLEWVLDSPPNVHQFEETPIVVEIEHLTNLKAPVEEH